MELLNWYRACSSKWWWCLFSLFSVGTFLLGLGVVHLFSTGVGVWGNTQSVAWGFAIVNFVWWIGIGHAGTLISSILLLAGQKWRNSINRSAEAMTLFAIACAALFPLFHLGRPWLFYWLIPYRTPMHLWPQYRSALVWDALAIFTYGVLSFLFWYMGLVPDLKAASQTSKGWRKKIYYVLSLGWTGNERQWNVLDQASILLAGLATVLVVSIHSIVSFDFAIGINAGWHHTLFPPYFVAGAIYSGLAMVLTLIIPMRYFLGVEEYITRTHFKNLRKLMVASGLIVGYGYLSEHFFTWYTQNPTELHLSQQRLSGPYGFFYVTMLTLNFGLPLLLSLFPFEKHLKTFFAVALLVNVGMWLERFVIVVTSLSYPHMVSSWQIFIPTFWDWVFLFGSLSLFFLLFLLFLKFVPPISLWEVQELKDE
jgi:molybdopterin-containing oxidoreductase family membrane subunit